MKIILFSDSPRNSASIALFFTQIGALGADFGPKYDFEKSLENLVKVPLSLVATARGLLKKTRSRKKTNKTN